MRSRALAAALLFAFASLALSRVWHSGHYPILNPGDEELNVQAAYNLVRHGVFSGHPAWTPDAPPWLHREPGHILFLALILATLPSFSEVQDPWHLLDPGHAAGQPFRDRYHQAEHAITAAVVAATFLAALALARSWPPAVAAGLMALSIFAGNASGNALIALLLTAHAVFLHHTWRSPSAASALVSGTALAAAALTEAVLQYWIPTLALLLALGLWNSRHDRARRRPLAKAAAVLLAAAALPVSAWMARNWTAADQFAISDRQGAILAIRAEYAQATWPEILGMALYWMPGWKYNPLRSFLMESFTPGNFGYARLDIRNRAGFYYRGTRAALASAERKHTSHSTTAARADALSPGWRGLSRHERDAVLGKAARQLILESPLKHLAVSLAMAIRGQDHDFRRYAWPPEAWRTPGQNQRDHAFRHHHIPFAAVGIHIPAKLLGLALVPAALVFLCIAARRRSMAHVLLAAPAVWYFGIHALAADFIARLAQPVVPLLLVVTSLAIAAWLRSRRRGSRRPAPAARPG